MKKFRFALQPLLNYRNHLEDIAEAELNHILKQKADLLLKLEANAQKRGRLEQEMQEKNEFFADELTIFVDFIRTLRHQETILQRKIAHLDQQIDKQRQILVRHSQERKVVEQLRTRRRNSHTQASDRFFQQESDDLFLQRSAKSLQ